MQIKYLHPNIYKLYSYARKQECLDHYRDIYKQGVALWEKLRQEGVSIATCQAISGLSRATYYRHRKILENLLKGIHPPSKKPKKLNQPRWGEAEKKWVLCIRKENPSYGKEKISIILKRDHGQAISESTVGRILSHLKKKNLILASPSASAFKRKRVFKNHAQPWRFKNYKDMVLEERVQIDHMTVSKNNRTFKHFQAWERQSKWMEAQIYYDAKSSNAKRFLMEFIEKTPYKVSSIQVDGGSEFRAEFEKACAELNIPLIVLPPKSPTYNGGVERGNRIFREEFYSKADLSTESIEDMRAALRDAVTKYNSYRPHRALKGKTPLEYIQNPILEVA